MSIENTEISPIDAARQEQIDPIASYTLLFDQVDRALKGVNYAPELKLVAIKMRELLKTNDQAIREGENDYLRSKNSLSEVFEYFGDRDAAAEIVADGEDILAELPQRIPSGLGIHERRTLRERVRYVSRYAAQVLYRKQNNLERAVEVLSRCMELFNELTTDPNLPVFGSRGECHYYLGRAFRNLNDLDRAESSFAEAIRCYWERTEFKASVLKMKLETRQIDTIEYQAELILIRDFNNHKIGKALASGVGWVNITRGYYKVAQTQNLRCARALLAAATDPLSKARINLLEGSVIRALAAREAEELRRGIAMIEEAASVFASHGNRYYQVKAENELCLAYLYLEDFEAAWKHQDEIEKLARGTGDDLWSHWSKVLASRILHIQGQHKEAVNIATAAIDKTKGNPSMHLCLMEALIARARAYIGMTSFESARVDLEAALAANKGRGQGNPKVDAVCFLRLAMVFTGQQKVLEAKANFRRWEELGKLIEHQAIHKVAQEVSARINRLEENVFTVSRKDSNLDYAFYEKKLRDFLIGAARGKLEEQGRNPTQQLVADELGVARMTLAKWTKPKAIKPE